MSKTSQFAPYRVLARKYRPQAFADLVGQEVLVRTLEHAFESGRVAHAYLLTGVRGTGKTTTARLIARALNCTTSKESALEPCGVCNSCIAIIEDRHVDVLEMDAASRTGIDDVRSLIDGVRYAPVSGLTKVYIIDEVHMLSEKAFNALLKTLEEPPPHVFFIFATTELRKLPLTVLSRCQRFDLRRVEPAALAVHLGSISEKENVTATPAALGLIARAAQGSVRDALSLLDQAIVSGDGDVHETAVQSMLGLADRGRSLDLLESLLEGDIAKALVNLREQMAFGADPLAVLKDLLDLTHWLTRLKAVPEVGDIDARTVAEQKRGFVIAGKLSMQVLARTWQMLIKGVEESRIAIDPAISLEMLLVRLAYVSDLPPPADVLEKLAEKSGLPAAGSHSPTSNDSNGGPGASAAGGLAPTVPDSETGASSKSHADPKLLVLADFPSLVQFAAENGEPRLHAELRNFVHLVHFEDGRIEFRPAAAAPRDFANRLRAKLTDWTGRSWAVVVSGELGAPTLDEAAVSQRERDLAEIAEDPTVQAVLQAFPGAKVRDVRDLPPDPLMRVAGDEGDFEQ